MITVYHNPRCGKSRECLAYLDGRNIGYEVVHYLKSVPDENEIRTLLSKLKCDAIDIVRTKEPDWQVYKNANLTDDEIIAILVKHPSLIERPIVINGDTAIIARPALKIDELL